MKSLDSLEKKVVTTCWPGVHYLGRTLVFEKKRLWVVYRSVKVKKKKNVEYRKLHLVAVDK